MNLRSFLLVLFAGTFFVSTSFAGLSDLANKADQMVRESSSDINAMRSLLEEMSTELSTTFNFNGPQSAERTRALNSYRSLERHYNIKAGHFHRLGFVDLVNEINKA